MPSQFKDFVKALVYMEEKGLVVRTRSNRYGLPEKMNLVRGKLSAMRMGLPLSFLKKPGMDDIFIPPDEINNALHGDTVLARVINRKFGCTPRRNDCSDFRTWENKLSVHIQKAKILDLLFLMIKNLTSDIFIPKRCIKGAVEGHKVVVKITNYPEGRISAEGEVIQILGHKNDPGVDILSIIYKHGLPLIFLKK